jgi:hypothetical protein
MVQASNEQSGKAHGETRETVNYEGRFWCHERKDYFSWAELIKFYNINNK